MKIIFLVILLIYSSISVATIENKTDVLWLTDDKDDEKNYLENNQVSIGTDTLNLVIKALQNYQLTFQLVSIPRINLLLKSNDNICVANRIKTKERALNNIFSLPQSINPGLRLYYLDQHSHLPDSLINLNDEVTSLSEVFMMHPDKVIGMSKGRSFGTYLDHQISLIPKNNVFIRAGIGRYEALMQMLVKKRIDYLIDFPTQIKQQMDLLELKGDINSSANINSLAIAKSPPYILGRIACTKTAAGEAFINEVNKILLTLYKTSAFYQAHARYINKNDLAEFKLLFDKEFEGLLAKH